MNDEPSLRAGGRRKKPDAPGAGRSGCGALDSECRARGERVVRAVLEATIDELSQVGYTALSVERVAERAGVNKTTIYRRYPTKLDLVDGALRCMRNQSITIPDRGNLRDDLIEMLQIAAHFVGSARGKIIFRTLIGERASNPELIQLADRMRHDDQKPPIVVFQRAIARGELPPETDLELLLRMVFGPVLHRVLLEDCTIELAESERMVDMLLGGVLVREPPRERPSRGPRRARVTG